MLQGERSTKEKIRHLLLELFGKKYSAGRKRDDKNPPPPERILLVRPDHIGDLLLATPSIRRFRSYVQKHLGEVRVTGMVGPWGEAVWRNNEFVDEIITCPFPGFTRAPKPNPIAPYLLLFRCASALKKRDFDTAVVMRFDHWWGAWLAAEAGIPRRIGFDLPDVEPFLTHPVEYVHGLHEVEQNWRLLRELLPKSGGTEESERLGNLHFRPESGAEARAEEILRLAGISEGEGFVVIHPGSGSPVKRWESEKWAYVAERIHESYGSKIVLTGGPGEEHLTGEIASLCRVRVIDLAGKTSLDVLSQVLRKSSLVMGPDSGILHLASSQGVPTIGLYGPADPNLFGPWPPGSGKVVMSDWECAPCGRLDFPESELGKHRCVRDIPVERVMSEVESILRRSTSG